MVVICVVSFSIDPKMNEWTVGKSKFERINIDMVFNQYQADFITNIYEKIQKAIDDKLIKAGMDLVTQRSIEVPI